MSTNKLTAEEAANDQTERAHPQAMEQLTRLDPHQPQLMRLR